MNLKEKKYYIIGIGGTGMSGLAQILKQRKISVCGSDIKQTKVISRLQNQGIEIFLKQTKENIQEGMTIVYSSAISEKHPERMKAAELGLETFHRSELLALLMAEKQSVGIAGMHGKTTLTGMIGLILRAAEAKPSIVVGGFMNEINGNGFWDEGDYLVAEADESDGSFLNLDPLIRVVTNLEAEHLDHYQNLGNIKQAFQSYLNETPAAGFGLVCLDDLNLQELVKNSVKKLFTYGLENKSADYWGFNIRREGFKSCFEVSCQGSSLGEFELNVPGIHNISNAIGAVACGHRLGIGKEWIKKGLAEFKGVQRRFEKMGTCNQALVYDDYAHHPTEVKATLEAAQQGDFARLIAVFQPHRYTRTRDQYQEFAHSLQKADFVVVDEVYPAGEEPIPGISGRNISDELVKLNPSQQVIFMDDHDEIIKLLLDTLQQGDLLLTMGAGNIREISEKLVERKRV